jgi:dTDP-4-dehydrorhamnose 3,5-epimerase
VKFLPTTLPGVLLIEPQVFQDQRGFFLESYQKKYFSEAGIPFDFVQDNHSSSCQGVLRGLHYQIQQPQGKLLRVVVGEIYDVALAHIYPLRIKRCYGCLLVLRTEFM